MGIWDKRSNKWGCLAGMYIGFFSCVIYMVGSRFYGLDIWGIKTISSGRLRHSYGLHRLLCGFKDDCSSFAGDAGLC